MTAMFTLAGSPLAHLLQSLRALYPPQCLVHVGIGQGMGELVQWRNWPELPSAVLIDADDNRLQWARHGQPHTWRVQQATLAATADEHLFYLASNSQEDGLVPPEQLKACWPQLETLGTDKRTAQTLDQIMRMADNSPAPATAHSTVPALPGHWLLLDCLPAAQLLRGANALLAQTSVVCARTIQDPNPSAPTTNATTNATTHPTAVPGTSRQDLVDLLSPLGFVQLAHTETHHPALGYTLMARPAGALLVQAQTRSQALADAAIANATTNADATANAKTNATAAAATDAAADAAADANDALAQPQLTTPFDTQAENQALHHRLALLKEELLRAEGQINLIKDLMLRDQEL